ncbi:hypothetical protein, partial [Micromonospora olivasterospora]|uniref:hypothetical protein n=1 Tax=Micromonospora olivasterospora TaxID=1880 RepID=UPI0031D0A6EB
MTRPERVRRLPRRSQTGGRVAKALRRLGAVAVAAITLGIISAVTVATPASAATMTICKSSPIPAGYVIIAEGSSISCPGSFPNT